MVEINGERSKRPRLKRLFLISAGVGLGLAVGIVATVAAIAWFNSRPIPTHDWTQLEIKGAGLRAKLKTDWDGAVRYGQQMMDWRNPPMVPATTVNFSIADVPQTVPNQPVFALVSFKLISEDGHFALEWLKKDTFGQKLIDAKTDEVMPHLKLFWDKVNGLTPEAATIFLQEQLEATARGTVSFFGIPVETRLAISASPVICFSILLFLCLHIRHLRLTQGSIGNAAKFPFAPLFKGAAGALLVTYATVLVLPVLANGELLARFGDWTQWSTRVGAVFTGLTTVTGVWAVVEIHCLRKRL